MAKKRITGIARMRTGPKRSRVKVGPWPFLFFLVCVLASAACAIAVNVQLEDRINAYHRLLQQVGIGRAAQDDH